MFRTAIIAFVLLVCTSAASAQNAPPARNVVYGELFGNAVILSVNYERMFSDRLAGRIGFTYVTGQDEEGNGTDEIFGFPLMVNYLSGPTRNHHLEVGGGLLLLTGESSDWGSNISEDFSTVSLTGTFGYRYQRPGGGFVFRSGFTPIITSDGVLPWFGISFGGNF